MKNLVQALYALNTGITSSTSVVDNLYSDASGGGLVERAGHIAMGAFRRELQSFRRILQVFNSRLIAPGESYASSISCGRSLFLHCYIRDFLGRKAVFTVYCIRIWGKSVHCRYECYQYVLIQPSDKRIFYIIQPNGVSGSVLTTRRQ
jgi:hypothetical protein